MPISRYCDVDLWIFAISEDSTRRDVYIRLHREYSSGCLPDWMVTSYKVDIHNERLENK